jgi:hypothetical protein
MNWIFNKLNDQDFMQKINVASSFAVELYRTMVSSFLILFVPQNCNGHICSLSENMTLENPLYTAGLVSNFLTMSSCLLMYYIEIKRENRLITYLEVNKNKPTDNDSVGIVLNSISIERKNNILYLDKYYQRIGYTTMVCFTLNSILSGIIVYEYYLDNQTTTTLITNLLFMVMKLADVYSTVHTEQNIFYSAYLKSKVQFNDIDPNKVIELKEQKEEQKEEEQKEDELKEDELKEEQKEDEFREIVCENNIV